MNDKPSFAGHGAKRIVREIYEKECMIEGNDRFTNKPLNNDQKKRRIQCRCRFCGAFKNPALECNNCEGEYN